MFSQDMLQDTLGPAANHFKNQILQFFKNTYSWAPSLRYLIHISQGGLELCILNSAQGYPQGHWGLRNVDAKKKKVRAKHSQGRQTGSPYKS